jgi:hypothetical protein
MDRVYLYPNGFISIREKEKLRSNPLERKRQTGGPNTVAMNLNLVVFIGIH